MGYKDENTKHRVGISMPSKGYKCPYCNENIPVKASFIICTKCKKVIDGNKLI